MGGNLLKLRAWWESADRTTKAVTFVGGGLLIALIAGVFYFSSSPDMKQLYAGLETTEQGRVVQKLQELKIPYRQDPDGSIFVPSTQVAEARGRLAQSGIPSMGSLGNTRLQNMGISTTSAVQTEEMRIALEEELQKTINMMPSVATSKVHIALDDESPFASAQSEPKASVMLQLRPGTASSREVGQVVATTVAGAVKGLKPASISVSDSMGIMLWDGANDEKGSGVASKKREAEIAEADRITKSLERMIAQTVGPGKAIVSASVEMNFDTESVITSGDQPLLDPKTKKPIPASEESVSESMNGGKGNSTPGGTPRAGNVATADKSYSQTHTVTNNPAPQVRSEKTIAQGGIKSAHVSIMLDQAADAQKAQIQSFAENLIGAGAGNENFKVALSTVPFDRTAADKAAKELAASKSGQMMQQIISLIPVLALIIVGFLVIKAVGKAAANSKNVLVAGGLQPLSIRATPGLPAPRQTYEPQQEQRPAAPPPPVEEALSDAARARRDAIKRSIRPDVDDIPEKFDVNLEQILRMADTRPESVALLVKSWLLEETN